MLQSNYCQDRERSIAECLQGLVSELRLIDVEYLISFVTLQLLNNIADLVASASENHFVPGFITMGHGCDVVVDWNKSPLVTIDMIMHLGWGNAYFSVLMGHESADVQLNYLSIDQTTESGPEITGRLRRTISENRINFASAQN